MNYGFVKVAAAVPLVQVADCFYNIEKIEGLMRQASEKGVQIIAFPELSVTGYTCLDLYAQQTGLLAARMLGVPCVNAVSSIEKTDAGIRVERSLENEVEVIELPLPAAVCVTSDINVPRIPTMKAILGAGKKPAKTLSTADIGWSAPVKTVELDAIEVPPRKERAHEVLEGDSAVADFAARIKSALK